ncbi:integrase [Actinophytocola glycyrrhizae]|uniref:Integrase n=1 Tax=Actinophytocola glycyrrhizae TaxID=2044873 RepID=A0ABV9S3A2_9PSEU
MMVARDGAGPKIARTVTSCAECLAWGLTYARGVCLACYNFSAPRFGHHVGDCGACHRRVPLKDGYCRLCWCQAREDRAVLAEDARSRVVLAPYLPQVRWHQLFLAGMTQRRVRPRTTPRRHGVKGRPPKPAPPIAARPSVIGIQLLLFDDLPGRDYRAVRVDLRRQPAPDNPWLAWALHLAHRLAEVRGWAPTVRRGTQRTLVRLLAHHTVGEHVRASDVRAVASGYSTNADYALEILRTMEHVVDNRPTTFDAWLDAKLTGLTPAIARATGRWARTLHDGGPRSRPRSPHTAATYLRRVRPALVDWSTRYDHLREVTHDDVLARISGLRGEARRGTDTALRSLFRWARRNSVIFRNPATGIRLRKRDYPVWQPLVPTDIAAAIAAATTPHARMFGALAAIHAARPGQIRALQLDDVDLAGRRLRIAGHERPLDDLTHHVLREWLAYRAHRWPNTANPHLPLSKETALGTIRSAMRSC